MGRILFCREAYRKWPPVASRNGTVLAGLLLLLHSRTAVAKPSYAAYTWSPVDAEILNAAAANRSDP